MFVPYNCQFLPHGRAANDPKIRETMKEWRALNPVPDVPWEVLAEEFALDAGLSGPSCPEDVSNLWSGMQSNTSARSRGPYYRLNAWLSP
jgi:hypothetical protein